MPPFQNTHTHTHTHKISITTNNLDIKSLNSAVVVWCDSPSKTDHVLTTLHEDNDNEESTQKQQSLWHICFLVIHFSFMYYIHFKNSRTCYYGNLEQDIRLLIHPLLKHSRVRGIGNTHIVAVFEYSIWYNWSMFSRALKFYYVTGNSTFFG